MTQTGATIPGQSAPGSNGNEGVLRILQSPSITGTSPSNCLVSYPGYSLGGVYSSADVKSVYATVQAHWVMVNCYKIEYVYPLDQSTTHNCQWNLNSNNNFFTN